MNNELNWPVLLTIATDLSMLLVYIATLGVLAYTLLMIRGTLLENQKSSYLQLYEVIARHHSKKITKLRREVMANLSVKAEEAKSKNKTLKELDSELHLTVSTLANYYEGLGMFMQGGWEAIFPEESKHALLDMLHNSVGRTWTEIDKYKDQIYPNRPPDWATSYQWLYNRCIEHKQRRGLNSAESH